MSDKKKLQPNKNASLTNVNPGGGQKKSTNSTKTSSMQVEGTSVLPETKLLKEIYQHVRKIRGLEVTAEAKSEKAICQKDIILELTSVQGQFREYDQAHKDLNEIINVLLPSTGEKSVQQASSGARSKPAKGKETSQLKSQKCISDVKIIKTEVDKVLNERRLYNDVCKVVSDTKLKLIPDEETQETKTNKAGKPKPQERKQTHAERCKTVAVTVQTEVDKLKNQVLTLEKYLRELYGTLPPTGDEKSTKKKVKPKKNQVPQSQPNTPPTTESIFRTLESYLKNVNQSLAQDRSDQSMRRQVLASTNDKKENEVVKELLQSMVNCGPNEKPKEEILSLAEESKVVFNQLKKERSFLAQQVKEIDQMTQEKKPECYQKVKKTLKSNKGSEEHFFPNLMSAVIEDSANKDEIEKELEKMKQENKDMRSFMASIFSKDGMKLSKDDSIGEWVKEGHKLLEQLQSESDKYRLLYEQEKKIIAETKQNLPEICDRFKKDGKAPDDTFDSLMHAVINEAVKKAEIESEIEKLRSENNGAKSKDADKAIKELQMVKKENEELQMRLSKVAGQRLTEGNPNITNLGDSNRPMKIGEAYSECYDNEWTDVMDASGKKLGKKFNEDSVVKNLSTFVMGCYELSKDRASSSMNNLVDQIKEMTKPMMISGIEDQILKHAIDARRSTVESSADLFYEFVNANLKKNLAKTYFKSLDSSTLNVITETAFYKKIVKLCWKMILQDPPMSLLPGKTGNLIDKNYFREYTSSGKTIVFTVWPALLLEENGSVVVKGVVKVK